MFGYEVKDYGIIFWSIPLFVCQSVKSSENIEEEIILTLKENGLHCQINYPDTRFYLQMFFWGQLINLFYNVSR